jgi:hypothetical protein
MILVSSVFRVLHFSHDWKLVIIDKLPYCMPNYRDNREIKVPFVSGSMNAYDSVGVGMFKDSSLMGTFTLPFPLTTPHTTPICMLS